MQTMNQDVREVIIEFCGSPRDLITLRGVSHQWHKAVGDSVVFLNKYDPDGEVKFMRHETLFRRWWRRDFRLAVLVVALTHSPGPAICDNGLPMELADKVRDRGWRLRCEHGAPMDAPTHFAPVSHRHTDAGMSRQLAELAAEVCDWVSAPKPHPTVLQLSGFGLAFIPAGPGVLTAVAPFIIRPASHVTLLELHLARNGLTDADLLPLRSMRCLRELDVSSNDTLASLDWLPSPSAAPLRRFEASSTRISSACLATAFANGKGALRYLEELSLAECKQVCTLAASPAVALETLLAVTLNGTSMTRSGFAATVAKLPHVESLAFGGCEGLVVDLDVLISCSALRYVNAQGSALNKDKRRFASEHPNRPTVL